ncbi:hypothetical protein K2F43_06120 [Clostridium estertheticum]|uniref:hypothetical protein n=1 Tax=Clostridium estertheticum TaxID=238834 RepID=UPI001C6ED2B1|nr:hypothetical protein [Clostridium estertheticum]MBW9170782.1 hypothetical protein [Clostridium estertheticum]WLC74379.1 hypothetical protein KTC99_16635 [Clostridium estertheticum]
MASKANIYISDNINDGIQFPNLPEVFPNLERSSNNEEFVTFNNGTITLLDDAGLQTFSMGFMLPRKQYYWCQCDAGNSIAIIALLVRSQEEKLPVRFVFSDPTGNLINILVSTEKFSYGFDRNLDFVFAGDFKEFRIVTL